MNFDEIKEFISTIVSGEKHLNMPLGIITDDLDQVRKYLESVTGAKRINNLLIAGADKYFDGEDKMVENITDMKQQLADSTKCNAKEYLEARAAEYAVDDNKLLFDVCYAYTPRMADVSRYIARKAKKPLIMLLSPYFAGMKLVENKNLEIKNKNCCSRIICEF